MSKLSICKEAMVACLDTLRRHSAVETEEDHVKVSVFAVGFQVET
jgi:hypothetical protein